jgi:hypothetical protein
MSDNDRTEFTTTGIVRKRNENGYIIHSNRHDTGGFDRRIGWSFVIGGVLTAAIALPEYGLRGMIVPLLAFEIFGMVYVRRGRRKCRRVGGYRGKRRTLAQDQDSDTHSLLESDPIWPYRHYWALLGLGSVGATVVVNGGPLVPLMTFIGIVALASYGWIRRGGSS